MGMEESKKTEREQEIRERRKEILRKVFVLVLIVIIIILLLRSCNEGKHIEVPEDITPVVTETPEPEGPVEGTGYINTGEEYDPEGIKKKLTESQYNCHLYVDSYVEFKDKNAEGVLNLKNLNDYSIQVHLFPCDNGIVDTSKPYFTSILIGPGEEMNKIKLTKNLDNLREGIQPCLLYYDCYKQTEDGYIRLGNSAAMVNINMLSVE